MLTDSGIKALKSKTKPFKIYDGGGLFMLISPNGAKLWRLKFAFEGKEKLLRLARIPKLD